MTPTKTSSSGWQSMITGSQTSMLLDWCQGRSTDVSSISNCAVQPIQWSFVDEKWPWITYDFLGNGFQGCVSFYWVYWDLGASGGIWRLVGGWLQSESQQIHQKTRRDKLRATHRGSARRSISSKKFAQPVRVAHGRGWVLKIEDVAGEPKILGIGSMFFPHNLIFEWKLKFPVG